MAEYEKKVDESWKEQVEREKKVVPAEPKGAPRPGEPPPPTTHQAHQPEPPPEQPQPQSPPRRPAGQPNSEFSMFLSSLSMQALMALGEVAHPVTGLAQPDPEQARYLIDILGLLHEKTQGNLSPEEASLLEGLLYELRMKYVEKTQGGPPVPPGMKR